MKTILSILTIFALLSGALYLFNQKSDEQSLQAYEEYITNEQGHIRWNLSGQNLDDQQIRSIAKSISRGKIQQLIGSQFIYSIYLDLSNNKYTLNFKPILESINTSLSSYLTGIYIDIGDNGQAWDQNFEGYSFPKGITHVGLIAPNTKENVLTNFANAISNVDKLISLDVNFYNGYFKNVDELAKVMSEQGLLRTLILNLNRNYTEINTDLFRDYLEQTLNRLYVSDIYLGLENMKINTTQLNDLEEIIYNKFQSGQYQSVKISLGSNSLNQVQVDEIFEDLRNSYGERFSYEL